MIQKLKFIYIFQHLLLTVILSWSFGSIVSPVNKYTLDAFCSAEAMGTLYIGHYLFVHNGVWLVWKCFGWVHVFAVSSSGPN